MMGLLKRLWAGTWTRTLIILGVLAAIGTWIAFLDVRPTLRHVDFAILSGAESGNYYASVATLADAAARQGGAIENVPTEGSVDNLTRLAAVDDDCRTPFALVQDGLAWPEGGGLMLVGRLKKSESLFLLGKDAERFVRLADLAGARVSIGADGSGTAKVARSLLTGPDLGGLGIVLENRSTAEGLDAAERGQVDLVALVIDEDAALVADAVKRRKLQIAPLANLDAVARRFAFLKTGRIAAGQYDAVTLLPPTDRTVLRVDTLVVVRSCVARSEVMGLLGLLADVYPDFVRHNQESPNRTGLPLSDASKRYFQNGGPEFLDAWLPRVSDVMPPENWVYTVMGVSILFNIMGFAHRFRLWRIDANRVALEQRLGRVFGSSLTIPEIGQLAPTSEHRVPETLSALDNAVTTLEDLIERCRAQSLSMLVPMGGEMAYRYQEGLMTDALASLRSFRNRLRVKNG